MFKYTYISKRSQRLIHVHLIRSENQVTLGEIQGCAESISRGLQSRENDVKAYEMAV